MTDQGAPGLLERPQAAKVGPPVVTVVHTRGWKVPLRETGRRAKEAGGRLGVGQGHATCWAGRLGVGFVLSPQPVYPHPGEPGSEGGLGESCPCGPAAVGGRPHGHWLVPCGRGRGQRLPATEEEALLSPAAMGNRVWSRGSHRRSGFWHVASRFLPGPLRSPLSPLWSSSSPCSDHRHAWCWGGS